MSNEPTPMNINIPNNPRVLGKRKGGVSSYNRANKRRDLSMVADVERITTDKVTIDCHEPSLKNSKL